MHGPHHLEGGDTTTLSEEEAGCRTNLMYVDGGSLAEEDQPRRLRLPGGFDSIN